MPRALTIAAIAVAACIPAGCGDNAKSNDQRLEIEEQLGLSTSSPGSIERQTRVENHIGDCMRALGFRYTPVDPVARQQGLTGKARLSDEEFLEQFGYGISTLFGRGSRQADPNETIRRRLSAVDRAAYDRALGGDNPRATFAEALDSGDFTDLGGCTKEASETVFGGGNALTALVGRLDELDQSIVEDQRMVRATEKWAACMGAQGFRYDEPDAIDADVLRRFQALLGPAVRPGATAPADAGTSYERPALAALQRREVQIATADLQCEQRHITPVESVVRPEYEQDFRRRHSSLMARVPAGR